MHILCKYALMKSYRVFHNALREIKLKYCQQGLLFGLKMGQVHNLQVGGFVTNLNLYLHIDNTGSFIMV